MLSSDNMTRKSVESPTPDPRSRRVQIVEATLALLAEVPPERISTRMIAARVGVTQPALFRHFDDRNQILCAVVDWMRGELAPLAEAALRAPIPALDRAGLIAQGLGTQAARHPGLPRLLLADVLRGESTVYALRLRELVATQLALVAELVRQGVDEGAVPDTIDIARAARLFVGGLQGLFLQWQMDGRTEPPDVAGMVAHWRAGVTAGLPHRIGEGPVLPDGTPPELDVRPLLASGVDPLQTILAATRRLQPGGALRVLAPFRPAPLLALLEAQGFRVDAVPEASTPEREGTWAVRITRPAGAHP